MTRNDPLVLRSAKQAPSAPSQGLEFGPSPKQQAQDKTKVKLKEEIIQTTENPCEKGATTNNTNNTKKIPATTTTKQESPCEKGASTTTKEECPCEKGATSNNTEQIPATTTKQESPCEKGATTTTSSRQDSSFEKGAESEVDYGVSSSSTAQAAAHKTLHPKKKLNLWQNPLRKRRQRRSPKALIKGQCPSKTSQHANSQGTKFGERSQRLLSLVKRELLSLVKRDCGLPDLLWQWIGTIHCTPGTMCHKRIWTAYGGFMMKDTKCIFCLFVATTGAWK